MASSTVFEDIPSGGDPEQELSMSFTGLTAEDLQPQPSGQLQQLAESLPPEHKIRTFLESFCCLTTQIRSKLSPAERSLDLATDTHLVGLEDTLAIIVRTYMSHPEDTDLHTANAEQTVGQIQRSLQALQK